MRVRIYLIRYIYHTVLAMLALTKTALLKQSNICLTAEVPNSQYLSSPIICIILGTQSIIKHQTISILSCLKGYHWDVFTIFIKKKKLIEHRNV